MILSLPITGGGGETISFDIFGTGISFGALDGSSFSDFLKEEDPFLSKVLKASSRVAPVLISKGSTLPPEQDWKKIGKAKISEKYRNFFIK